MINKLLITCLQRNKRLVIPTLGAFIRKKVDGVGEILVFVPFLNKDDGMLCQAIKSWAGVEQDDAEQILTEYIATVKDILKEKNQYFIEGVGVLKYDSNGIIYLAKEQPAKPVTPPPITEVVHPVAAVEIANLVASSHVVASVEPIVLPVEAPVITPEPIVTSAAESLPPVLVEIVPPAIAVPVYSEPILAQSVAPVVAPPIAPQPVAPVLVAPVAQPISQEIEEGYNPNQYQSGRDTDYSISHQQDNLERSDSQREERLIKPTSDYTPKPQGAVSYYDNRSYTPPVKDDSDFSKEKDNTPEVQSKYFSTTTTDTSQKNRYSSIYGDSSSEKSDVYTRRKEPVSPQRNPSEAQRSRRKGVARKPVKKNKDLVLWIAIIAVAMTICILIYGQMYGGEQILDSQSIIENIDSSQNVVTPIPESKE